MWYYPSGKKIVQFQQNNIRTMTRYNVIYLTFKQGFAYYDYTILVSACSPYFNHKTV